jgi:hypothetical protein
MGRRTTRNRLAPKPGLTTTPAGGGGTPSRGGWDPYTHLHTRRVPRGGVGGGGWWPVPRQKASKPLGLAGAGGWYAGPPGQLVRLVRPGWPPVGGLELGGCWGIRGTARCLGRERGFLFCAGLVAGLTHQNSSKTAREVAACLEFSICPYP